MHTRLHLCLYLCLSHSLSLSLALSLSLSLRCTCFPFSPFHALTYTILGGVLFIPFFLRYHEDRAFAWDRWLHCIMLFLALPLIVTIFDEDAFYSKFDGVQTRTVPSIVIAASIGAVLAIACFFTSKPHQPPKYNAGFSGLGFVMGLAFIYVIADEIVGTLTAFGVILGVSESTVGMTVLGIGNGTCDLIANYLVAVKGFPIIAVSAVYSGPVLNTYVGLGLAALVGILSYDGPYKLETDIQLYFGIAVLMFGLLVAGICSVLFGRLTKQFGYFVIAMYICFVIGSIALELSPIS